jgi:hypothetical protein
MSAAGEDFVISLILLDKSSKNWVLIIVFSCVLRPV